MTAIAAKRQNRVRETGKDRVFNVINIIFWIIVLFIVLYPLWLILIASVSDPDAVLQAKVLVLPVDFSLMGYEAVFQYKELWGSYLNSIIYTVVGSGLSVVVTLAAAYSLAGEPGHYLHHVLFRRPDPDLPERPGSWTVQHPGRHDPDEPGFRLEPDGSQDIHPDQYPQ